MHQAQHFNDLSDSSCIFLAIRDPSVINTLDMIAQEISIVRHKDSTFAQRKGQMSQIICLTQTCLGSCRDIYSVTTQSYSYGPRHMLIQVKT